MSTELKRYEPSNFIALNGADEELQAGLAATAEVEEFSASDLIRVSVPTGGGTNWEIQGVTTETAKAIEGVLVHSQKYGVLWPSDEPQEGAQPVLRTFDFKVAEQIGEIPPEMVDVMERCRLTDSNVEGQQLFDWTKLPYTKFGSGKNGIGKRAKEQRLLGILRENDIYPILVRVPPGSIARWKPFFVQLTPAVGGPPWRAVVRLELEKATSKGGQVYSQIVPSLIGSLSPEDGKAIHERYTKVLSEMASQVADLEESSPQSDDEDPFGDS